MAYRRRRRRPAVRRGKPTGSSGIIFAVIVIAIGIIVIAAFTPLGRWIENNVFSPLFGLETPLPSSTHSVDVTPDVTAAQAVTCEITLPSMDFYMLQMGVFTSQDNADSYAEGLKKQGGAGYVYEDDGRYRVVAYAYSTAEDANTVKQRLVDSGYECAIFTLPIEGATYRVTATEAQISSLTTALQALETAMKAVGEAALKFDAENLTIDEGKTLIQEIYTAFTTQLTGFSTGGSMLLDTVNKCCNTYKDAIDNILVSDFEETIDFSSLFKYTQVKLTCEYARLTKELTS